MSWIWLLCDWSTVPGVVSNLTLNSTHDSILAIWNSPEGNYSSFSVTLQLNNTVETIDNLQETSKNFTGLRSAANYTVIIFTVLEHLKSLPVESSTLTCESLFGPCGVFPRSRLRDRCDANALSFCSGPLPPKNVSVSSFGKDQITLEWQPSANFLEVSYRVNISSRFWNNSASLTADNDTSHVFGGLHSGTRYELAVRTEIDGRFSTPETESQCTGETLRPKGRHWLFYIILTRARPEIMWVF